MQDIGHLNIDGLVDHPNALCMELAGLGGVMRLIPWVTQHAPFGGGSFEPPPAATPHIPGEVWEDAQAATAPAATAAEAAPAVEAMDTTPDPKGIKPKAPAQGTSKPSTAPKDKGKRKAPNPAGRRQLQGVIPFQPPPKVKSGPCAPIYYAVLDHNPRRYVLQ